MLATAGFATNRAASEGRNDIQYQQRQAEQYRDKFPLHGQTVFLDRDFANSAKADHREGGEMAGYTAIAARLNEGSASRPASTVKRDQPLAATALAATGRSLGRSTVIGITWAGRHQSTGTKARNGYQSDRRAQQAQFERSQRNCANYRKLTAAARYSPEHRTVVHSCTYPAKSHGDKMRSCNRSVIER
jgi:hypothetical protein